jgi:hypothetical protein
MNTYVMGVMILSSGPPLWEIIRSADGDFAFSMPAKPALQANDSAAKRVASGILEYSCQVQGTLYEARRTRRHQPVPFSQAIAELARLKKGYLEDSAKLVRETKIVVDGVPGDDLVYTVPSAQGGTATRRIRYFLKDPDQYEMIVTSPPGQPLPDDATRFLSSLTFEAVGRANHARANAGPKSASQYKGETPRTPSQSLSDKPNGRTNVIVVDSTPEDALRTFMLALAAQDETTLRAITLPDKEFDWLLKDRSAPVTPEDFAKIRAKLDQSPIRRLSAGDRVRVPGGNTRVVQRSDVGKDRVVLWAEGSPYPARIERVNGHWKVLARTFILARKSDEAELKRGQRGTRGNR